MTPDAAQPTRAIGYGYDSLGQVVTETYPDNATVAYTRNALGQVTAIGTRLDGGAVQATASNAGYYPNGALKQFTYGNGIVHTMAQNARQLPSRSTDGTVLDLGTTFDVNGNVAGVTDYTTSARQTKAMAYDGLDRLTGTTSPMFGSASYRYDAQDNLAQVQVTGGSAVRNHYYCHDGANRLAFLRSGPDCNGSPAVVALGYDAQGNLAFRNGSTYSFDYGNRLRGTAGQRYRYDADGRRVRSDTAGSQLQYSQYAKDGRLVWQRDEVAGQRRVNVYLAGSLVAEYSRPLATNTVTASYFHTDALGSPIAKTDASGTVTETSEYEPFGKLLNRANDDKAGYTGHVMDAASGLIDMQQRWMDPQIGRFLSVDPVTATSVGGNFNRYWYGNNNPYKFKDPDGRFPGWLDAILGIRTDKTGGQQQVNQFASQVAESDYKGMKKPFQQAAQTAGNVASAIDKKVEIRLDGTAAMGGALKGSVDVLHGKPSVGIAPVAGEGVRLALVIGLREPIRIPLAPNAKEAPAGFSMDGSFHFVDGLGIGADVRLNGAYLDIKPALEIGGGAEFAPYPNVNYEFGK